MKKKCRYCTNMFIYTKHFFIKVKVKQYFDNLNCSILIYD